MRLQFGIIVEGQCTNTCSTQCLSHSLRIQALARAHTFSAVHRTKADRICMAESFLKLSMEARARGGITARLKANGHRTVRIGCTKRLDRPRHGSRMVSEVFNHDDRVVCMEHILATAHTTKSRQGREIKIDGVVAPAGQGGRKGGHSRVTRIK